MQSLRSKSLLGLLLLYPVKGPPQGAPHQGFAAKRRQLMRRLLRKAVEGIIEAPGEETAAAAAAALRV